MALTVKQAILAARAHFVELLPEIAKEEDVRLEEIERTGEDWAITFSVPGGSSLMGFTYGGAFGLNRIAKVIVVDGETGQFIAL